MKMMEQQQPILISIACFIPFNLWYSSSISLYISLHELGSSYSEKNPSYTWAIGQIDPDNPGSDADDASKSTLPKCDGWMDL